MMVHALIPTSGRTSQCKGGLPPCTSIKASKASLGPADHSDSDDVSRRLMRSASRAAVRRWTARPPNQGASRSAVLCTVRQARRRSQGDGLLKSTLGYLPLPFSKVLRAPVTGLEGAARGGAVSERPRCLAVVLCAVIPCRHTVHHSTRLRSERTL